MEHYTTLIFIVPCRAVFQLVTLLGGVSGLLLCHVSHVSPLLPYLACRVLVDVSRAAAVCLTEGTTSILVKYVPTRAGIDPLVFTITEKALVGVFSVTENRWIVSSSG